MISRITGSLFCLFCLCSFGFASSGEELALSRLSVTTDMLVSIGEELMNEPMAGMLLLQDTVSIDVSLSCEYSYQLIMWTESTFNYVDFWLTNPQGGTPRGDFSDHTTFSVMPDSQGHGIWNLQMELLEGAACDTAYYAVAVLRRERLVI